MELRLVAYNGGYSKKIDQFLKEASKKASKEAEIDLDFYTESNYTEDQWKLLDLFEKTGIKAVTTQAPFQFSFNEEKPNIYTGVVLGCSREKKYKVVLKLRLNNLPDDAEITFSCGIHSKFRLEGDTAVIESEEDPFLGGISDMPSSEFKIFL